MSLNPRGFNRTARRIFSSYEQTDPPVPEAIRWKIWDRDLDMADSSVLLNSQAADIEDTVVFPAGSAEGAGTRVMFDPILSAVRGGVTTGDQWDAANRGLYSTAFGTDTVASGEGSTVLGGINGQAAGDYATVLGGVGCVASGDFSLAAGTGAQAVHSGSFVWGDTADPALRPAHLAPVSAAANEVTFTAAGGFSVYATGIAAPAPPAGAVHFRADTTTIAGDLAVTGLIDPTGIQLIEQPDVPPAGPVAPVPTGTGIFWVDSTSNALQFSPANVLDPAAGTFELTDNAENPAGGGGGAFSNTLVGPDPAQTVGLTRIRTWAVDATQTPDFVFPGTTTEGNADPRVQLRYAKGGAFRAGNPTNGSTYWDDANTGQSSMGFGLDPQPFGDYSSVLGGNNNLVVAAAPYSVIGAGRDNFAYGSHSFVGVGGASEAGKSGTGDSYVTIIGGHNATLAHYARGSGSFIGGGGDIRIGQSDAGPYSAICGGGDVTIRNVTGATAMCGQFGAIGNGGQGAFLGYGKTADSVTDNITAAGGVVLGGGDNNGGATIHLVSGERGVVFGGGGDSSGAAVGGSTVSGMDSVTAGTLNNVSGNGSTAIGYKCVLNLDYSLLVCDRNTAGATTTDPSVFGVGPSSWAAAFSGGYRFNTTTNGPFLDVNDTSWQVPSDRALKENVGPLTRVLERLGGLDVHEYNYKGQPRSKRCRGPMAQRFHELFPSGKNERRIETMDLDAVILAGIQELASKVRGLQETVTAQYCETQGLISELSRMPAATTTAGA